MAFDLYAGGFTRFYAREWENVAQKHARQTGMRYQRIHPGDDPGPARWEEVEEAVQHWKTAVKSGLRENAPDDLEWNEGRESAYFTDRPGWDGYSALVLLAACTACNEPMPERLPKDALTSEIVLRTYSRDHGGGNRSITQAQLWLPGTFEFSFDFVDLCNQKIHVGSVKRLNSDLRDLMTRQGITETEVATALQAGYEDGAGFRPIALFGLAVFMRVAQEALRNQLPIMLSY